MMPPDGPSGFPTVSPNQLRIYGAGGFRLDEQEFERGCPRQYKARYEEKRVQKENRAYPLRYGSFFHDVLFKMEEHDLSPDAALQQCFPADMEPEGWLEAKNDLTAYLERGSSPTDKYGTLSVENELDALLYVDEEFGPIHMRGFVDWMGIDIDDPTTLHIVDYKTNRHPPLIEDVRGDVQLKTYHWLAMQNREKWGIRRVVVHLDAIKWRELEVRYSDEDIEDWHGWAVAVVRKILRDNEAKPVLNPGCSWCPVKDDCPVFIGLPETAETLAEQLVGLQEPEERLRWRDAANKVRLLLEKSVKEIDADFKQQARAAGYLRVGSTVYEEETQWSKEIDLIELHEVMGPEFYDVVGTSEKKLRDWAKNKSPSVLAAVMACVRNMATGSVVKRKDGE